MDDKCGGESQMRKGDKGKKIFGLILILAIVVLVFGGVVSAEDLSGGLKQSVDDAEIQTAVGNLGYRSDLPVTGKGIWIWKIWDLDESVSEIIDQLQNAGVEWVTIKCGDSDSYYLTPGRMMYNWLITNGYSDFGEVVTEFHDAGIKVVGWHYVWSYDKWSVSGVSETDVSNQILDIAGIDGLIINAEGEYEGEGKGVIAEQYMEDIRAEHPNSFIAYSTFAIIDYHPWFPYLEFGKYCDAVMPQDYWKEFGKTPTETVDWMKQQWDKWHAIWASGGYGDSIKPIIPTGQGYGGVSGNEITEFCNAISGYGYGGVSLWRYGLMTDEIWDAYATKRPPIAHASDISNQPDVMHPDTLYEVTAKYYDPDGRTNLYLCTLGLAHPSDDIMMGWGEDLKMPVETSAFINDGDLAVDYT